MNMSRAPLAALALIWLVLRPIPTIAQEKSQDLTTGILGALSDEVTILEQTLENPQFHSIMGIRFTTGVLQRRRVVVASSGAGKVNAAMSAALLIHQFKPSEILFSGIAGAINPDLHPGDIVIGEKTAQHDLGDLTPEGMQLRGMRNPIDWERNPVFFDADPKLLALADIARKRIVLEKLEFAEGERAPVVVKGIIVTGDVFIASPAKKNDLRKTLKADAVEMEGAAVAQVCRVLRVPCLVIRSISDDAGVKARQDLNRFYAVAAQNSIRLVTDIVRQLGSPGAPAK